LEEEFNSDWNLLLESMMEHAVGDEEYELAAEIRDYLIKYK
jgi:protein-arginine kinase activator protein McsA